MKKPSKIKCAPGFTRISVKLPNDLLAELDAVAAADNRTRSNLLTYMIRQIITSAPVSQGLLLNRLPNTYCPMSACYMEPDDAC